MLTWWFIVYRITSSQCQRSRDWGLKYCVCACVCSFVYIYLYLYLLFVFFLFPAIFCIFVCSSVGWLGHSCYSSHWLAYNNNTSIILTNNKKKTEKYISLPYKMVTSDFSSIFFFFFQILYIMCVSSHKIVKADGWTNRFQRKKNKTKRYIWMANMGKNKWLRFLRFKRRFLSFLVRFYWLYFICAHIELFNTRVSDCVCI